MEGQVVLAVEMKTKVAPEPLADLQNSVEKYGNFVALDLQQLVTGTSEESAKVRNTWRGVIKSSSFRTQAVHLAAVTGRSVLWLFASPESLQQAILIRVGKDLTSDYLKRLEELIERAAPWLGASSEEHSYPVMRTFPERVNWKYALTREAAQQALAVGKALREFVVKSGLPIPPDMRLRPAAIDRWNNSKHGTDRRCQALYALMPSPSVAPLARVQERKFLNLTLNAISAFQLDQIEGKMGGITSLVEFRRAKGNRRSMRKWCGDLLDLKELENRVLGLGRDQVIIDLGSPLPHAVLGQPNKPQTPRSIKAAIAAMNSPQGQLLRGSTQYGPHDVVEMRRVCIICGVRSHYTCSVCDIGVCRGHHRQSDGKQVIARCWSLLHHPPFIISHSDHTSSPAKVKPTTKPKSPSKTNSPKKPNKRRRISGETNDAAEILACLQLSHPPTRLVAPKTSTTFPPITNQFKSTSKKKTCQTSKRVTKVKGNKGEKRGKEGEDDEKDGGNGETGSRRRKLKGAKGGKSGKGEKGDKDGGGGRKSVDITAKLPTVSNKLALGVVADKELSTGLGEPLMQGLSDIETKTKAANILLSVSSNNTNPQPAPLAQTDTIGLDFHRANQQQHQPDQPSQKETREQHATERNKGHTNRYAHKLDDKVLSNHSSMLVTHYYSINT
jgi:hypothetical protein